MQQPYYCRTADECLWHGHCTADTVTRPTPCTSPDGRTSAQLRLPATQRSCRRTECSLGRSPGHLCAQPRTMRERLMQAQEVPIQSLHTIISHLVASAPGAAVAAHTCLATTRAWRQLCPLVQMLLGRARPRQAPAARRLSPVAGALAGGAAGVGLAERAVVGYQGRPALVGEAGDGALTE